MAERPAGSYIESADGVLTPNMEDEAMFNRELLKEDNKGREPIMKEVTTNARYNQAEE